MNISNIKIDSLPIKPPRKLKAKWTVESKKDLLSYHKVPLTAEEIAEGFEFANLFSEMYPIGSTVCLNMTKLLGLDGDPTYQVVRMTSLAVPNLCSQRILFLCNKSQDETDFYDIQDTLEFEKVKSIFRGKK